MLIRTTRIPKGYHAFCVWPFIFVHPDHAESYGLIEHEMVHYREQRRCLMLPWWLLYGLSRRFRQAAEVRAYRRQIAVGGITADKAADYLLGYHLGITKAQALALLTPT